VARQWQAFLEERPTMKVRLMQADRDTTGPT